MIRQLQLFSFQQRLRRIDTTLDRLKARYSAACRVSGDFAAQRLQHEFDNLAITRAMVAHRVARLSEVAETPAGAIGVQGLIGARTHRAF